MPKGIIQINFCKSLNKWAEINAPDHGDKKRIAKEIGISAGHFSNICAGRRFSNENERRRIAKIISMNYDMMVGVKEVITDFEKDAQFLANINPAKKIIKLIIQLHQTGKVEGAYKLLLTYLEEVL